MEAEKYFYNLKSGQVERGRVADMASRMGPYETYAEARNALSHAEARNEAWEEAEREWQQE